MATTYKVYDGKLIEVNTVSRVETTLGDQLQLERRLEQLNYRPEENEDEIALVEGYLIELDSVVNDAEIVG